MPRTCPTAESLVMVQGILDLLFLDSAFSGLFVVSNPPPPLLHALGYLAPVVLSPPVAEFPPAALK